MGEISPIHWLIVLATLGFLVGIPLIAHRRSKKVEDRLRNLQGQKKPTFCIHCGKPMPSGSSACDSCGAQSGTLGQPVRGTQSPPLPDSEGRPAAPDSTEGADAVAQAAIPPRAVEFEATPKGLGGWLIVVALGLFVGLVYWCSVLIQDIKVFNDGTVQLLSNPSSTVHFRSYSALVRGEMVGNLLLMCADVCLLWLFFRKSRRFPTCYTLFLVAVVVFAVADYSALTYSIGETSDAVRKTLADTLSGQEAQIGRSLVAAMVWGIYMQVSKRVKATFIS